MLAQIGSPPPGETQVWLLITAAMMGFYWMGRQIYLSHFPKQSDDDRFVTHAHLDDRLREVKTELGDIRRQFERSGDDVKSKFEKIDSYLHESSHRLNDAMGHMRTDLAWMKGLEEGRQAKRRQEQSEDHQ